MPPPPGLAPPAAWGTEPRLVALFGHQASGLRSRQREFVFRYRSAEHWVELFRDYYGPTHKAFAALDEAGKKALHEALLNLLAKYNRGGRDTLIVPSDYLEVVIKRA